MTLRMKFAFPPVDEQGPPWDLAHLYLDEQHPTPEDSTFAVGVLCVPEPVPDDVIRDALESLPSSSTARARGFFHAKDDGPDAQRALAKSFGGWVKSAEFRAFRWTPAAQRSAGPATEVERHMHVASLAAGEAFECARYGLTIEVASGPTVEIDRFRSWFREHTNVRLGVAAAYGGQMPMRFPDVQVRELPAAHSPGVQVADLLLWHERRLRAGLKPRCKDLIARMRLNREMDWQQEDGPMETAVLGLVVPRRLAQRPSKERDLSWAHFEEYVVAIEQEIHNLAKMDPPPRNIAHLGEHIRAVSQSLRGTVVTNLETLARFAATFLLVVDTTPLYDPTSAQHASNAAGVAAGLIDLRAVETISRMDRWIRVRRVRQGELGW